MTGAAAPTWPAGTVRRLLDTALVTEPTRAALRERLQRPAVRNPRALSVAGFATLGAVCARLLPQPDRGDAAIDVAGAIDTALADGPGNGWRYATMPPDAEAWRQGLCGLEESAQAMFGAGFVALAAHRQDAVLTAVQRGEAPGAAWATLPAVRFFEELLALAVESYYAHPLAQEEIGYVGMADAQGWHAIGLSDRDAQEPLPEPSAPRAG